MPQVEAPIKRDHVTTIRLPVDMHEWLARRAEANERRVAAEIRSILGREREKENGPTAG